MIWLILVSWYTWLIHSLANWSHVLGFMNMTRVLTCFWSMKNIFAESELICILKLTGDLQKETMDVNLKAENEAIKFLYACLEDIELERVTSMAQRYEYKQNLIVYSLISFQSYDDWSPLILNLWYMQPKFYLSLQKKTILRKSKKNCWQNSYVLKVIPKMTSKRLKFDLSWTAAWSQVQGNWIYHLTISI